MQLIEDFQNYITANHLFTKKDRLLLAVSGGVDSVVLCDVCHKAGYDFAIAHCNFMLRNEESDRDEYFVKVLAEKYGVEFFSKKFDTVSIAADEKKSIETAARDLRYNWFKELINDSELKHDREHSLKYILTAHHADDNIETVAMNFFRGTGITGLRGIQPKQQNIIRPLLFARRKMLENYALHNNLEFVTDSTNASNDYTRNLFRNTILPAIETVYPSVKENVLNNIDRFTEVAALYNEAIDIYKKKLVTQVKNEFHIPINKLAKQAHLSTMVYEIGKDFGFASTQTSEIIKLLSAGSGKYVHSATHRMLKNRDWLIIAPLLSKINQHILIEEKEDHVFFEEQKLVIEKLNIVPTKLINDNTIALIDAANFTYPLLLRRWKQGDYFYPLGMKKKKKLSRFFIDQKLSILQKENTWVIEMDKKILWIVGMRIDDRFKINAHTQHVLKLTYQGT